MSQPSFVWPAELEGQQGHTPCSWQENPSGMFHPPALGAYKDKGPSPYGDVWGEEGIVLSLYVHTLA